MKLGLWWNWVDEEEPTRRRGAEAGDRPRQLGRPAACGAWGQVTDPLGHFFALGLSSFIPYPGAGLLGCLQSTTPWKVWNLVQIRSLWKGLNPTDTCVWQLLQFGNLQCRWADCKWAHFTVGDPGLSPHFHASESTMMFEDSFPFSFPSLRKSKTLLFILHCLASYLYIRPVSPFRICRADPDRLMPSCVRTHSMKGGNGLFLAHLCESDCTYWPSHLFTFWHYEEFECLQH